MYSGHPGRGEEIAAGAVAGPVVEGQGKRSAGTPSCQYRRESYSHPDIHDL